MRLTLSAAVLLFLVAAGPQLLRADEDAVKAQKLIDRCVEAMGGKKALEKTKRTIVKDKGVYYGMGDGVPYEGRYVFVFGKPGRFRMEIVGFFTQVVDKDKGWMSVMGSTMDLEGDALKAAQEGMLTGYAISLIPLQKPNEDFKISLAGTETVDGEKCEAVNVDHKGMPTCTIYFSTKSGLIKKTKTTTKDAEQGFKEVTDETVYHEYKKFDGFLNPVNMTIYRDGKKYVESKPTSVTYPENIEEKEFQKPE